MTETNIQDLELNNELINRLATLRSVLKGTVKIGKILELEMKKLEKKRLIN